MKLLFVYNADSGLLSSLKDTVHKVVSPNTYQCNLCKVTFGPVSVKQGWREYIASLSHDVRFLHRDEFLKQHPEMKDVPLPALFVAQEDGVEIVIPATTINTAHSVDDMIALVSSFLERMTKQPHD